MTIRVAAGAIVLRDDRLLMVRLGSPGDSQFWIPPGGGMEPGEGAFACAEREAYEETGLRVKAERLAYIQELTDAKHHHVKFWVLCTCGEGEPHIGNCELDEVNDLHEARFIARAELSTLPVVPAVLLDEFWDDLAEGFSRPRYLGLTRARF